MTARNVVTVRGRGGRASRALHLALIDLAAQRRRPRCAEAPEQWLSDNDHDRAAAAKACAGCPLTAACVDAALEQGDRWAVRGAVDLRDPDQRRGAERRRTNRNRTEQNR